MNNDTIAHELPALTANMLREGGCLIDNLFADLWNSMGIKAILKRIGFDKRSGIASPELTYCLMLWVWTKANSINMFAREALQAFSLAQRDVLNHSRLAADDFFNAPTEHRPVFLPGGEELIWGQIQFK